MSAFTSQISSSYRTAAGRSGTQVGAHGVWVPALRFAAAGMTVLGMLGSSAASAATPVTLKAEVVDSDGVVTLGDLFDGAGVAGRTPIASRAGASVMLSAAAVRGAAMRAGLDWPNAQGYRQIGVTGAAAGAAAPAARGNVDVLTWARSIAAGEIVQPQDMIWA